MTDLKDTIQVGIANGSAIGVSLVVAIAFTIYKFFIYEKKKIK